MSNLKELASLFILSLTLTVKTFLKTARDLLHNHLEKTTLHIVMNIWML